MHLGRPKLSKTLLGNVVGNVDPKSLILRAWRREWDSDEPSLLRTRKLLKIRIVKIVKTRKTQSG